MVSFLIIDEGLLNSPHSCRPMTVRSTFGVIPIMLGACCQFVVFATSPRARRLPVVLPVIIWSLLALFLGVATSVDAWFDCDTAFDAVIELQELDVAIADLLTPVPVVFSLSNESILRLSLLLLAYSMCFSWYNDIIDIIIARVVSFRVVFYIMARAFFEYSVLYMFVHNLTYAAFFVCLSCWYYRQSFWLISVVFNNFELLSISL